MRHWLLRFVAATVFFAISAGVSFGNTGLRTSTGPDDVESRCVAGGGGGVNWEVCTPWS